MSEWISVKDRLPSHDGKYLVLFLCLGTRIYRVVDYTNSYNGYDADYTIPKGAQCFYSQSDEVGDYEVRDVTHWMPLPEPPKDK